MTRMINRLRQAVRAITGGSSAATVVEYAVVIALIIMVCIVVVQALGGWNSAIFAYLAQRVSA